MKRSLIFVFALAFAAPAMAQNFITNTPGFFGRVYSDVEGYAFGAMRPLDTNAPTNFTWDGALTLLNDDDVDGYALSLGYGRSAGANPWRFEVGYGILDGPGGDTDGVSVAGIYQLFAGQGTYAVNVSAGAERIDDAYDVIGAAVNGELRIPRTDFSVGASLGFASADFEFGGSESDLTAAVEAIYSIRDYGIAFSAMYQNESDLNDSAGGITATWAIPPFAILTHSNLQAGILDDLLFIKYRARF